MILPSAVRKYVSRGAVAAVLAIGLAACRGSDAGAPPAGGPMAMPVEAITLQAQPVDRTTEYIATVKSRRSTTIQPQVEGFITRITARPGQRVGRGATLMEIDSNRQEAAVASLESIRAARQADVQFAQQQADRMRKLYEAGAVSQQEQEQASTALETTKAQLLAIDAQIREQRVELAYHRVTAPTAGIVGDIPVRVGDRVTRATELTTIDESAGLELYISVPVAQAADLRPGMLVRIADDDGEVVATSEVNFIAPSVDAETQSVLVKAPLESSTPFRTEQLVRVRVVWSTAPGLTVPLVAVTRVNAQYFVFVVEDGEAGATVARQRAVQLGELVGNAYLLVDGLQEGDRLVVGGVQKIRDGMPVTASPPAAADPAPAGRS